MLAEPDHVWPVSLETLTIEKVGEFDPDHAERVDTDGINL